MALWLVRGVMHRRVTTKYPAVLDEWTRDLPSPPTFRVASVSAVDAARLVDVCPSRAFFLDGSWLVLDLGACSACGACTRLAPDLLEPSGIFELTARLPEQLRTRLPIQGLVS